MNSDNHMTDICERIVATVREHPRMFREEGMEAKLWGHAFSHTNPHMFLDPWDLYRRLPDLIGDFMAMWFDQRVKVEPGDLALFARSVEGISTATPQPEDVFGLIIKGRDAVKELLIDPAVEAKLFAYCLNVTRPHSEAHGRTMNNMMPQVLQQFLEIWSPVFEMLPAGLSELNGPKTVNEIRQENGLPPIPPEQDTTIRGEVTPWTTEAPKLSTTKRNKR